jgi:hypothetical protein
MNTPAVKISAPSRQPALELIALAQLAPDLARHKLRALLLTNPNYFGKIPPSSFSAVLNIQEDTTYESISRLSYDPETDQLSAAIDVKQTVGYSSEILVQGSEEFVRFYVSYDGRSKWHDLGMRSVTVANAPQPRPFAYEVALQLVSEEELTLRSIQPKIRAILSWSTPPPAGEPNWTPVWGDVAEADVHLEDSQVIESGRSNPTGNVGRLDSAPNLMFVNRPMDFTSARTQGHFSLRALHSTMTDPHHRFLAYVLARAASYCSPGSSDSQTEETHPFQIVVPLPESPGAVPQGIS